MKISYLVELANVGTLHIVETETARHQSIAASARSPLLINPIFVKLLQEKRALGDQSYESRSPGFDSARF